MNSKHQDYRHVQFKSGHANLDFDQIQALFQQAAFLGKRTKSRRFRNCN
jgi:hypothetical protein